MMTTTEQTLIEVALAKMEGKLDVLVAGLDHIREDFQQSRTQSAMLESRVSSLEKQSYIDSGEKTGIAKVVKVVYATCGLVGTSAIAAIAKYIF
jgi:hypothetical protein